MACFKRSVIQHLVTLQAFISTLIGIKKKLVKLSKYKDCELVGDWVKSITNHLYWCAVSAPEGDSDEMTVRWKSLMEHLGGNH